MNRHLDGIGSAGGVVHRGPEGAAAGGEAVGLGTPPAAVRNPRSRTGRTLRGIPAPAARRAP